MKPGRRILPVAVAALARMAFAFPIGLGPSRGGRALYLYRSAEHGF
jgi:hypothetical protein